LVANAPWFNAISSQALDDAKALAKEHDQQSSIIKLEKVRLSFPSLFRERKFAPTDAKGSYSATFILDNKSNAQGVADVKRVIETLVREGRLTPEDLARSEEIFLTATSCGLFPVTRLDGAPVGHGTGQGVPGPVTTRLLNTYCARKNAGWHITPVETIA
jgi:hypothetical protein